MRIGKSCKNVSKKPKKIKNVHIKTHVKRKVMAHKIGKLLKIAVFMSSLIKINSRN